MSPLPAVRVAYPHIVVEPDGTAFVEGTRVPVRRLYAWHRQGTSTETLLRRYPQLGPARLLSALAFAYDNLELMAADLARERELLAKEGAAPPEAPKSPRQRAEEARKRQTKLPFER